uniref:RING-type domain-containing protein n=1 Tax=Tetranychus urticae TaxID=32264 RepID=T1KJT3_TETUR
MLIFNDREIEQKDVNITPLSLDIGNGVDVFVDIVWTDDSLADIECPICLSTITERCYNFPCNHLLCINCSLKWFFDTTVRTFSYDEERSNGCPLCRAQVEQFHFKISDQVITVDHRFLGNLSDDELFDWTSLHLNCGFRRTKEQIDVPVKYLPTGFGGY